MKNYVKFHRSADPVDIQYDFIEGVNDGDDLLDKLIVLERQYGIALKFTANSSNLKDKIELWKTSIKKEIPNLRIQTYI